MTIRIPRCTAVSRVLVAAACVLLVLAASVATAAAQASLSATHKDGNLGDTLDIGRVRVAGSVAETISLTNSGPDATMTLSIGIDDMVNFSLDSVPGSVADGATEDFTVTCTPTTPGEHTATITIGYTLPPGSSETLAVTCHAPALWVDEKDPYDFGDQEAGSPSSGDALTLINDSGGSLSVESVSFSGTDCGDFAADTAGLPAALADGDPLELPVIFTPGARGARGPCTMTIVDDDGTTDNTVVLVGNGVGAVLTMTSTPLDFGSVRVKTDSPLGFTITNEGDTGFDLDIAGIAVSGDEAADFVVSPTTATISPGANQLFTVTFTPDGPLDRDALLSIDASEPVDLDRTLAVTGVGTQALLVPRVASRDFGDVRVNGSNFAARSVPLDNPGAETVTIGVDGITLVGQQAAEYSITSDIPLPNITIAGGNSSSVDLRCNPTVVGVRETTLHVISDDDEPTPPAPVDDVALTCTGVRSYISVSSAGVQDFGPVLIGDTVTRSFTISNLDGVLRFPTTLNATLSTASTLATPPSQFDTSIASITNLAVDGEVTFDLECTPTVEGALTGTFTILSDDLDSPTIDISLECAGVKPEITKVQPATSIIDFLDVQVDSTSGPSTVRLRNDGSSDLILSSVTRVILGADHRNQFAHSNPGTIPFTIAPGDSADWTATCTPTSLGLKTTTLRFVSNDADESPLDIELRCNGVEAELTVSPTPVGFGDVRYCETNTVDVDFSNDGGAALTVSGITMSRSEYSIIAGAARPFNLAPGASETLTLQFEPSAGANQDGEMTITSTDPSSPRKVALTGNGVVAQMSISAMTHDFGDVRVDQAFPSQVFTITNTDSADFTIASVTFTAATTEFAIEAITALPVTLGPTQTAQFRVRARPSSLGLKSATLRINTDIPSLPCGSAPVEVAVDANGVVPDLSVNPTALDFGPQDLQASPATENLTVMNTGTAPLEISDIQLSGDDAARFTMTSNPLPFTIPVSGSATVQVTYTPLMVRAADNALLRLVTDAQSGMNVDVPLTGRGIDRDLVPSVMALNFPETYRNPDQPPQLSVQIDNLGEAPLSISMVTKSGVGEIAFTLVDNLDPTIAGLSNDTLIVEFDPSTAGDFAASLIITNDDDQRPMVEISLQGRGRIPNFMPDRGVYDMTQGECDLSQASPRGCIGVGIPTKLTAVFPEGIRFTNLEPQAFQVRALRLVDVNGVAVAESLFRVINFQSIDIGPAQVYSLDVEFTAPEPGEYFARLEVFLGNDPDLVQFVEIRAIAVEVRLRGGGCDAGGGGGGGIGVGILLLAGLALLRRRGRGLSLGAPAQTLSRWTWLAVLSVTLAWPGLVAADRTRNLDLTTFRPMPSVETEMLSIEGPSVGENGAWWLGVFFNHAVNPLNLESPQIVALEDSLVGARSAFDLGFAYAFADRFEAGVLVPLLAQGGTDSMVVRGVPAASGLSLGDLAIHGKVSLLATSPFSVGLSATLTVPTAADGEFAGVDGPTGHLRGIAGLTLMDRLRVLANAGFRARGSGEFGDLEQGHEATYGLGLSYRAMRRLWVVGELYGAFGMSGSGSTQGASPLEMTLGARYRVNREVSIAGGVGTGILPGVGAADARGIAFVSFAPRARELAAFTTRRRGPVVDLGDDDADGIANSKDACPNEPEDIDQYKDGDGCPDPDNDGDGLPDGSDPCPLAPEDKDGYKDDDGCPDLDNDEDGIPDDKDKCPDVPEDKDGYQDRDGCDDPDNDTDGIPDVIDQCALEPETINGKNDDDGCPDAGESLVMIMPDRVEVFEPIRFARKSNRISKKSHNVLGQVAATLRANRSFLRLRIAVHVHPRGSKDLKISQARALAVRKWLTQWGIEPERLEVKGFGSARPLVPKNKRGAAKVNDRVEFIILEKRVNR